MKFQPFSLGTEAFASRDGISRGAIACKVAIKEIRASGSRNSAASNTVGIPNIEGFIEPKNVHYQREASLNGRVQLEKRQRQVLFPSRTALDEHPNCLDTEEGLSDYIRLALVFDEIVRYCKVVPLPSECQDACRLERDEG